MTAAAKIILAAVAAFAGLQALAHWRANVAAQAAATDEAGPVDLAGGWGAIDLWGMTESAIESRQVDQALQAIDTSAANLRAFLQTIIHAEGTDRAPDPYRVCYGYRHTIESFADHPAITGEWRGEDISQLGPQYAGQVSTAAGAFQINRPTWIDAKRALGLVDFTPESQRRACVWLIKDKCRALDDVQAGRLADAIAKCAKRWASLPGAGAGQPERKLAALQQTYTDAGGYLA